MWMDVTFIRRQLCEISPVQPTGKDRDARTAEGERLMTFLSMHNITSLI